jgi:hypothetical protein
MKRTDLALALGMLAAVFLAGESLAATGTLDGFLSWTWERHHNVLSWYVRLLFLLPLAYFSYRRSLSGIVLTLVALATSMFWFPAPERVAQQSRSSKVREGVAHRRVDHPEDGFGPSRAADTRGAVSGVLEAIITLGPDHHQCHRRDEADVGCRRRWGHGLGHARARLDGARDLRRGGALRRAQDGQGITERSPACCAPSWPLSLPTMSRGLLSVAKEEPAEAAAVRRAICVCG